MSGSKWARRMTWLALLRYFLQDVDFSHQLILGTVMGAFGNTDFAILGDFEHLAHVEVLDAV